MMLLMLMMMTTLVEHLVLCFVVDCVWWNDAEFWILGQSL